MKLQLKTITGLDPELVASSQLDPASILMEMEARFNREEPEALFDDLQITHGLLPRIPRAMLRRKFGKWLPKGADAIIAETSQYLTEHAKERGYPLDASDLIASTVFNVQRIADLEKWKAEQTVIRRAQRHYLKQETSKQLVNGKRQWVDAEVYELPPLMQSEGKSLKHQDARYAIRLPDGRYFDLGQTDGKFKPILSDGPDIAMQRIAKRAGLEVRGGAHSILQVLTGLTGIVPAYTTVWHRHQWLVIVGWQRDSKITQSSYYKGEGELTMAGSPEDRLTLSELDYHLLKGAAEGEIEDAEGHVVDYMNDDEELILQGLMRDESDEPEPMESFLLVQAAANMGLSIELRNGSAIWNHPELRDQLALIASEVRKERNQLTKRIQIIRAQMRKIVGIILRDQLEGFEKFDLQMRHMELGKMEFRLKNQRSQLMRSFKDQLADLESQSELIEKRTWTNIRYVHSGEPFTISFEDTRPESANCKGFASMRGTESNPPLMEPIRTEPFMAISPANAVPTPKIAEADSLPPHRAFVMNRVKRGTTALVETKNGLVAKRIDHLPQAPITARNAPPTLKARLRAMIREELESGTHEQEVADTFAIALEQALRGALRA